MKRERLTSEQMLFQALETSMKMNSYVFSSSISLNLVYTAANVQGEQYQGSCKPLARSLTSFMNADCLCCLVISESLFILAHNLC
jgi:hypothetical protein